MISFSGQASEIIITLCSAVAGSFATFLTLRKKFAADKTEMAAHKAEHDVIEFLNQAHKEAINQNTVTSASLVELQKQHGDCISENITLSKEIENLITQVRLLKQIIDSLQSELQRTKSILQQQIEQNAHLSELIVHRENTNG